MKTRPLTASLHTVTAVTRVAVFAARVTAQHGIDSTEMPRALTADALALLGYEPEQYADAKGAELFAACLASVRRAIAGGAK